MTRTTLDQAATTASPRAFFPTSAITLDQKTTQIKFAHCSFLLLWHAALERALQPLPCQRPHNVVLPEGSPALQLRPPSPFPKIFSHSINPRSPCPLPPPLVDGIAPYQTSHWSRDSSLPKPRTSAFQASESPWCGRLICQWPDVVPNLPQPNWFYFKFILATGLLIIRRLDYTRTQPSSWCSLALVLLQALPHLQLSASNTEKLSMRYCTAPNTTND